MWDFITSSLLVLTVGLAVYYIVVASAGAADFLDDTDKDFKKK